MNTALWRDISILILSVEALVWLLIALAVAYFLARGVSYVLGRLREAFSRLRGLLQRINAGVEIATDRIVAPVLAVERAVARARGTWAGLRSTMTSDQSRVTWTSHKEET